MGRPYSLEEIQGGGYDSIIGVNFDIELNVPPCILRIPFDKTQFSKSIEILGQVVQSSRSASLDVWYDGGQLDQV